MGLLSGIGKAVKSVGNVIGGVMDTAKLAGGSLLGYLQNESGAEGALASLGKFGLDTVSGLFSSNKQLADQKELMKYANDYNNPVAQMERLAKAGLNPNLVYANGAANLGSATGSVSAMKPASFDPNVGLSRTLMFENLANARLLGRKLWSEGDSVDKDVALKGLQQQILQHNLEVARATGTPVGSMPSINSSLAQKFNNFGKKLEGVLNDPRTAEQFLEDYKKTHKH